MPADTPPKTPTRVNQCVHLDDFMDRKREVKEQIAEAGRERNSLEQRMEALEAATSGLADLERRVGEVEQAHGTLENTMRDLKKSIDTVEKAIIGDIRHPEVPGMAENVRQLVQMHELERKSKPFLESVPWKVIVIALGAIAALIALASKLADKIP